MNRFWQEMRIIPRTAWIIGLLIYLGMTLPLFFFAIPNDPKLGKWPMAGQAAFVFGICFIIVPLIALVGYVYADAKRRGMRYILWTLLSIILIGNGIGFILYFILRDPMPKPCPGCSRPVKAGFTFCPHCGTSLAPTCTNCGRAVDYGWANCPHCGTKLPSSPSNRAA
jgi:RNA polymerase subunit RPABC4/transcription elongation factor Spt4